MTLLRNLTVRVDFLQTERSSCCKFLSRFRRLIDPISLNLGGELASKHRGFFHSFTDPRVFLLELELLGEEGDENWKNWEE